MNTGRSLINIQKKQIDKQLSIHKKLLSDKIVVFKSTSTVQKISLGSLSK